MQSLWPAWISPHLGPEFVLLQWRMLEAHHSNIQLSLARRFYWCALAFWLIGELVRNKAIFSLILFHGFDLGFICVVWNGDRSLELMCSLTEPLEEAEV